jgi:WD40 repeat protein
MAGPEVHHLFHHPIADHSFSADRKTLAVARDTNVELYTRSGSNFTLQDELKGHDKTVTGVDIAPHSGMIVTCSQGAQQTTPPHHRYIVVTNSRSQCLRLGAFANRLETHPRSPQNQSCSHICPLVTFREEVCSRVWSAGHCSLLF